MFLWLQLKYFYESVNTVVVLIPGCEFCSAKSAQFSSTLTDKKLNDGPIFSKTVITHFLDKPYQEINFKNQ